MITENKKLKLAFQVFSLLCVIAIAVCLICDVVINKAVTWSGYSVSAIPFAWVIISALLLAKKRRILCSLIALTLSIMPFLYLLERLTPLKDWFEGLGMPIAIAAIIAIWLTYCLIKFFKTKMNVWYIAAMILLINGVFLDTAVEYITNSFFGTNFFRLSNILNIFACAVLAALFAIIGHYKNTNMKLKQENERIQLNTGGENQE